MIWEVQCAFLEIIKGMHLMLNVERHVSLYIVIIALLLAQIVVTDATEQILILKLIQLYQ